MTTKTRATERRATQRFTLSQQLEASISSQRVAVVDLSLFGAGIVHSAPLQAGRLGRFELSAEGETVSVIAEVVRCRFTGRNAAATEPMYVSGIRFHDSGSGELASVRRLLTALISRALEEEKLARRVQFAASA